MSTRSIEIWVGIFVAAGLAGLFVLAMKVSNLATLTPQQGYTVHGYFQNVGGLKVRSPVTAAGVRVGRVSGIHYDRERFEARVEMTLNAADDYFPIDTSASIYTSGLLGEQYIALDPGAEDEVLKDGDLIEITQSALVLEQLVGKFIVNMTDR